MGNPGVFVGCTFGVAGTLTKSSIELAKAVKENGGVFTYTNNKVCYAVMCCYFVIIVIFVFVEYCDMQSGVFQVLVMRRYLYVG